MSTITKLASILLLTWALVLPDPASLEAQEADTTTVEELQEQIEAITRELERMRLGGEVVEADTSILGFGPAASKVYRVGQGVSIGGYGEVLYENFAAEREDGTASGKTDQLDALRAIVYVGYKFNDRFIFNSEIEFEHGSTGQAGSASVEFAYLDYLLRDDFGIRAGVLLSPMGFVNELHEPPVFLGTERPVTENRIIPTTWRENGIGVFGGSENFAYRVYLMNSLDGVGGGSSKASGFSDGGLRGGRQKASKALAEDFGVVGRVDYVGTLGLTLGGSAYYGETAHNRELNGETVAGGTLIWEGHAEYKARGWDLRALVAGAHVNDVTELNQLKGLSGQNTIGEEMLGWYLQAGYDLLRNTDSEHELLPYVRYERVNTQHGVPDGLTADPANDETIVSLGAAWKPISNIVWKADYQIRSTEADTGLDQFNVAIGYLF